MRNIWFTVISLIDISLYAADDLFACRVADEVCVGVTTPTRISLTKEVTNVKQVRLEHLSGSLSCSCPADASNWGCDISKCPEKPGDQMLGLFVTQECGYIDVAPDTDGLFTDIMRHGEDVACAWYEAPGVSSHAPNLTLPVLRSPLNLSGSLEIWYGEDLCDFTEEGNKGRSCATMYLMTQSAEDCDGVMGKLEYMPDDCDVEVVGGIDSLNKRNNWDMYEKEFHYTKRYRRGKGGHGEERDGKRGGGDSGIIFLFVLLLVCCGCGIGGGILTYMFCAKTQAQATYPASSNVQIRSVDPLAQTSVVVGQPGTTESPAQGSVVVGQPVQESQLPTNATIVKVQHGTD